jgi:demethylmenaquinone methyltransferase/2-methoxy-6-polyprenyl-1,4-benzoquinol methylase
MRPEYQRGYGKLGREGVGRGDKPKAPDMLPVLRTKAEAKQVYDRLSKSYDYTLGLLGRKYSKMALKRLSIVEGETVLEIGFGTGHCLKPITTAVGLAGRAYGIDISPKMIERAKKRLEKAGFADRVGVCCGDAASLPFDENAFDAVFMSFSLEVFDTPEIPVVLAQIRKALRPGGRLGIVAMSKEDGKSIFLRVYEWIHSKCPKYLLSRPIYAGQCLIDAGYEIKTKERIKVFRLPAEIILATRAMP